MNNFRYKPVTRRYMLQGVASLLANSALPLNQAQGGLNLYRIFDVAGDLNVFAERTLDVPACYIAGAHKWGVYQTPGAFEAMQRGACTKLLGVHLVKGAGHSVAEEQPQEVNRLLIEFLQRAKAAA